jgi:hypothetical protein
MVVRAIRGTHACCFQQGNEFGCNLAQLGTLAIELFEQTLRLVQASVIGSSTVYISGHEVSSLSCAFRERKDSIVSVIDKA